MQGLYGGVPAPARQPQAAARHQYRFHRRKTVVGNNFRTRPVSAIRRPDIVVPDSEFTGFSPANFCTHGLTNENLYNREGQPADTRITVTLAICVLFL